MTTVTNVNAETTKYGVMKDIAKFLEIPFVGKNKTDLAAEINAEIEKRGGEIQMEETKNEQPAAEVAEETNETPENAGETSAAGNEAGETEAAAPAPKWYEDGYGNNPGDRITILGKHVHQTTDHPKVILVGREAEVVGPSKKKDMIQAILINEKTGEKQDCIITLAFGEYADKGTVDVAVPPRKTRKKATEVVAEQPTEENKTENPAAETAGEMAAAASETNENTEAGNDSEQQAS